MKNLNDRFYNGYLLMNCIFIADFFPWKLLTYTVLILILGAHVIAAIASIEIPLRQWNELLPLINRCCSKRIPQLVGFFLKCGANRSYDDEWRIMSLNALSWTIK